MGAGFFCAYCWRNNPGKIGAVISCGAKELNRQIYNGSREEAGVKLFL